MRRKRRKRRLRWCVHPVVVAGHRLLQLRAINRRKKRKRRSSRKKRKKSKRPSDRSSGVAIAGCSGREVLGGVKAV